jgi:hypothetical protein
MLGSPFLWTNCTSVLMLRPSFFRHDATLFTFRGNLQRVATGWVWYRFSGQCQRGRGCGRNNGDGKGMDKVVAIPLVCIPVGSNSLLMLPFFILQPLSNKFLVLRCVTPLPSLSCFQRAPGAAFFACQVGSTILLVALSNNQVCLFSYTLFNTTFLTSSNIFHHVFDVTPCVFQVINLRLI